MRGELCWDIIPELHPIAGEPVIDKPGNGRFYVTDLEMTYTRRIENIILTGITTDVCVSTTMREGNDWGFDCLVLSDCSIRTKPGSFHALLSENSTGKFTLVKYMAGFYRATSGETLVDRKEAPIP